jgi:site-specific DNA-cytosine methylase
MCDDYDVAVCTPSATKKAKTKRGHSKLTTAAPKAAPKARKTPVNAVAHHLRASSVDSRPTVGTDCSGGGSFEQALDNIGFVYNLKFGCDNDASCKSIYTENFCPEFWFDDVTTRASRDVPSVDVYASGFPCQPFSSCGLRAGIEDEKNRGTVVAHVLDTIRQTTPRLVLLENVKGLLTKKFYPLVEGLVVTLRSMGYETWVNLLNTNEHGIPHHRPRFYLVAIKKNDLACDSEWPEPVSSTQSLKAFLGPGSGPAGKPGHPYVATRCVQVQGHAVTRFRFSGVEPLLRTLFERAWALLARHVIYVQ